ncbi:MAG: rolling circle replication-associated protein, partial [Thermoplasmata archaeon]
MSHVEDKIANLSGFIDTSGVTLYWDIIPSKNEGGRSDLSNGVSIESRLRLMRYTERLETAGYYPSHMLTITLQQWDNNVEKWKITKRTFLNDYLRKYEPIIGYLWFQEFQKRGAPHLHILLQMDDVIWDRSL